MIIGNRCTEPATGFWLVFESEFAETLLKTQSSTLFGDGTLELRPHGLDPPKTLFPIRPINLFPASSNFIIALQVYNVDGSGFRM